MSNGIFKCGIHDFSTDDINKSDKHYAEIEHEYDLQTECATGCGKKIHIIVKQKLSIKSGRIPRGHMCKDCRKKVPDIIDINEVVIQK